MHKAFGLVVLGCLLVVAMACNQSASTPTQPAPTVTSASSGLESMFGASTSSKYYVCHFNSSTNLGSVVQVSGQNDKRHALHLASDGNDCIWLYGGFCGKTNTNCDPFNRYWDGIWVCNAIC